LRAEVKKKLRLRRQGEFQRVLSAPRLYAGRTLVAFARPGPGQDLRVGFAVSRQVRGAVARNRAKRRLREVARDRLLQDWRRLDGGIGYDVVLIARPAVLSEPLAAIERDLGSVAERLREP
jgi:ribonuclease P protein component